MEPERTGALPRKLLALLMVILVSVTYGYFAAVKHWFPSEYIGYVRSAFDEVFGELKRPWFLSLPGQPAALDIRDEAALEPGLVMIAGTSADKNNFIRVMDRQANVVQEWVPDWFDIWAKGEGDFPPGRNPNSLPGAVLHGVKIVPNGDVILNYEFLSTIRLNACGEVVWKLDNHGHHSVNFDEDGNIWVGAERYIGTEPTGIPNHNAPLNAWAIQKLAPDGTVLRRIEIFDLLQQNGLLGLMHVKTLGNDRSDVWGDTMHPNDVEIFPSTLQSEIFAPGDIMLSIRDFATVLVFDPETLRIKFRSTGILLRQHDPDFIGNDQILVFDNRNLSPLTDPEIVYSRIAVIDARTGEVSTWFKGEGDAHFYTSVMGRQQLLPNGNLMITSPREGRAMEVDRNGRLLWQFFNQVDDGFSGLITEAEVLPEAMDADFFAKARAMCGG